MGEEIEAWMITLSKEQLHHALQSCVEFLIDTEDVRISSGDFPFPYWVSCGENLHGSDS